MSTSAPRSLADQLRAWSVEALAGLLRSRPDLSLPAPQDSGQLASRASTRASVMRVLDQLDRFELTVLEALAVLDGRAPASDVAALVNAAPDAVHAALDRLLGLALVWGSLDDLRLVGAVSDTLGTTVSGLGRPLAQLADGLGPARVAEVLADAGGSPSGDRSTDLGRLGALLQDPARVTGLLEECDAAARAMVEHLAATGAEGASEVVGHVRAADARTPVEQLLARGLLVPASRGKLAVPREAVIGLRGGRTTPDPVDVAPALATGERSATLVDRAAAGAAYELVHRTELLLDRWGEEPPGVLRQGGLGVRDVRTLADLLHADERTASLVVEVAAAAGLLGRGPAGRVEDAWLPTDASDRWRHRTLAERWADLADAWLHTHRLPGLVGGRVQGKAVNALAPDLAPPWAADTRRATLHVLASLGPGQVLSGGDGLPSLVARVRWLRPRRPTARDEAVAWTLEEAAVLGVVGLGGLASHGRALLVEGPAAAASTLAPLMPAPVDHVLLQADLTAVAPGPLEQKLARDLATVAHVESRGGATVYRFTEASVRHAFDVGWSAHEVHEVIGRAARTDVPQPLRYLVDDVARTHGTIRLGVAESFVRSDDEASLAALAASPGLGLRRIAPTVLVSTLPADELLPLLREAGVSPVIESATGVVQVAPREAHRARTGLVDPRSPALAARAVSRATATAAAIRAGDRAAAVRPPSRADRQTPASALALLREAAEQQATVVIGYVDDDGTIHDRVVDPIAADGGRLRAYDHRSDRTRAFAVHRIKSVRDVTEHG
ncbi:helicase-associated domain-containing protein [Nocardioides marmoribigeumensis]|uniref:Helicase XPB/Ssl2 N-terminal domain-containing protein n=1 Tax=Nocardioides marmoribigeumensis TaxID=433649 RepID=A0ABU2BSG4_9ACTN|nr:helicase-associated domain-containing protein [Nocardioides marmoribigeumensis]MDR7361580.1 hypothetical protein [Nocardioides marmoribigeumensis]